MSDQNDNPKRIAAEDKEFDVIAKAATEAAVMRPHEMHETFALLIRAVCDVSRQLRELSDEVAELRHAARGIEQSLDQNIAPAIEGHAR